jgi:hypothetical protein
MAVGCCHTSTSPPCAPMLIWSTRAALRHSSLASALALASSRSLPRATWTSSPWPLTSLLLVLVGCYGWSLAKLPLPLPLPSTAVCAAPLPSLSSPSSHAATGAVIAAGACVCGQANLAHLWPCY